MKPSIYRSKSILFYCLFRFFEDFGLIYPVYMILFQRQGLSYVQISLALAVWTGSMLILEVPSGILADLWSRKAVIALSMVLKAGGFLIWAFKPDFTGFLIGFIAWGAEEAFCSGATDALLFDVLRQEKIEPAYEAAAGAGEVSAKAGIVTAMIAGGFLFDRHPQATMILSAAPMMMAGLCVLLIAERKETFRIRKPKSGAGRAGSLFRLGQAIREAARIPGLTLFIMLGSVVGASYGTVEEFDTLYGRRLGVPVGFIGLWGAFRFMVEGAGAALSPVLRRRFRLYRPGRLMLWMLAAGLVLLFGTLSPTPLLAPLYFAYYGMIAPALVIYQGAFQRRIGSTGRATLSSLASFLSNGAGMGLGILFGLITQHWGLSALFRSGAAVTMIAVALYALYSARAGRPARNRTSARHPKAPRDEG
jgi:predicted MFS family arabinose efflux permease